MVLFQKTHKTQYLHKVLDGALKKNTYQTQYLPNIQEIQYFFRIYSQDTNSPTYTRQMVLFNNTHYLHTIHLNHTGPMGLFQNASINLNTPC